MPPFLSTQTLTIKLTILAGDLLLVFISFACAVSTKVALSSTLTFDLWFAQGNWALALLLFLYPLVFYTFELYSSNRWDNALRLFVYITAAVVTSTGIAAFVSYLLVFSFFTGRIIFTLHCLFSIIFLFSWRQLYTRFVLAGNNQNSDVLLLGSSPVIDEIQATLTTNVHSIEHGPVMVNDYNKDTSLAKTVAEKNIRTVVVADKLKDQPELRQELLDLRFIGVTIFDAPYYYEVLTGKVPVTRIQDSWFVFHNQGEAFNPALYRKIKKILDVILALTGILLAMPLMAICSLAVKMSSKGPVFFKQERLGKDEQPFTMVKFRTMVADAEKLTGPQWATEDDPRITKVGKFLRKSRMDELPQLFNVLRGDISFVGPRPIRKHFADLMAEQVPYYRLRFVIKPGLTGWAQVRGDYAGSAEGQITKLQYDLFYLRNQSLLFDLFIILKTVQTVLFRRGA